MKRLLALACLCSLVVVAFAAPGVGAAKPVLKVGTSADFPPFEFQDEKTGAYLGFDLDLIRAIGDAIGMDVQIVNTAWDGLIPGLITGNYDCIVSAMTITDERLKAVNFSDPYFSAGQVVVTMAKDTKISSIADLEGKKISVQIGTTGDLVASEIKGATVKRFNLAPDAVQEVRNGAAHACIIDLAVAAEITKEYKDIKYGAPFTMEYYGIAIKKNNTALLKNINRGLAMIKASGKYDEIYNKWFAGN
ncbi:MAG TPA: basic amino acid ABC transporter substrate-binding protein [Bacillota bacterium]|nr:basic amino acid ABC transporter substrate-binding protein [Bacillota bacterium]HQD79622.1 basic amino acid ABC transporter substrate-binding protein [Bacillota bacterium]